MNVFQFLSVSAVRRLSVMRITVFQQTVGDVADFQQVLVVVFLHSGVDRPTHNLHTALRPVLNVVPSEKENKA